MADYWRTYISGYRLAAVSFLEPSPLLIGFAANSFDSPSACRRPSFSSSSQLKLVYQILWTYETLSVVIDLAKPSLPALRAGYMLHRPACSEPIALEQMATVFLKKALFLAYFDHPDPPDEGPFLAQFGSSGWLRTGGYRIF